MSKLQELKDYAAKLWDEPTIYDPGDVINKLLTMIDKLPPDTPSVREALGAMDFLKSKNMIKEGFSEFIITGDFGKVSLNQLLYEFAAARAALAVEQKWVSTDERLPMKSGDYLTYETNHGIKVISVMRFDDYNKSWYDDGDCFHPSHWQNLPFPPTPTNKT